MDSTTYKFVVFAGNFDGLMEESKKKINDLLEESVWADSVSLKVTRIGPYVQMETDTSVTVATYEADITATIHFSDKDDPSQSSS